MKRLIPILLMSMGFVLGSHAQSKDSQKQLPKEDIKVNREYDEKGNLIRFDSTYTYNWSGDTTLLNSTFPEEFEHFFDQNLSFFNDSTFGGNSFQHDFDQLFFSPFSSKRDSIFMKKFGENHLHSFKYKNDSIPLNLKDFDEFFGQMMPHKSDSIQSEAPTEPFRSAPRSIDDMLKMMQKHMQQMEEMQQRFFEEYRKSEKQPKMKDL